MVVKEICLPTGTVLKNRYELVSVIGTGGFGITYQAVDRLYLLVGRKNFKVNRYFSIKGWKPRNIRNLTDRGHGRIFFLCVQRWYI